MIQIVPMKKEHIDSVCNIEKICFASPWTEEGLTEELYNENAHFIVAEDNEVCGYIGVQEICGEAYITNIAVLPEYRRMGIGKSLLVRAMEGAEERKCAFITLEVRVSNRPAISLYESLGFTPVGNRKNFYSSPVEDAVIYTKYF